MGVKVEWTGEHVCTIVIDRPEKRNAVDLATLRELSRAQQEAADGGCRAVVLAGSPPAFCSGADLGDVELGVFTDTLTDVLTGFGRLECATIAAIDGPALGAGAQLAAACDLRMATPDSRVGIPAVRLGLAVDAWTIERIGREAGWSTARQMLLTGESMTAGQLLGGFIHRIGSVSDAIEWACGIASLAPLTIAAHKRALESLGGAPVTAEEVESARMAAWESADAVEGRRAFLEKRPPDFTGR